MRVAHRRDPEPVPAALLADPRLEALAGWGRRLAAAGLSPGASGNMSCRVEAGFVITRTEVELADIRVDDWVLVRALERRGEGTPVVASRGPHPPSRDAAVHAAVYRRHPGAETVFHFHVGRLDELHERLGVPRTAHHHPAGTVESMEEIERFFDFEPAARYFILLDHGIVAWGESIAATGELVEDHHRRLSGDS